jgi:hypothetical protein
LKRRPIETLPAFAIMAPPPTCHYECDKIMRWIPDLEF